MKKQRTGTQRLLQANRTQCKVTGTQRDMASLRTVSAHVPGSTGQRKGQPWREEVCRDPDFPCITEELVKLYFSTVSKQIA